jgi:methyl-accepting chemotaxis protein
MKKLTFQQKLWIPLICSLLCITVIFVYNALEIRKIRIEERSADLSNAADLGLGAVKMFGDLRQRRPDEGRGAKAGHGRHQSMRRRDRLSSIINLDAVVVMNRRAANEWQEHVGFQANGTLSVPRHRCRWQERRGQGLRPLLFPRPGQKNAEPKMSRVVAYKPWAWTIVVGVYMDDIDAAFRQSLLTSLGVLLLVRAAGRRRRGHQPQPAPCAGRRPRICGRSGGKIANNDLSSSVHACERPPQRAVRHEDHADQLVDAISEIRHSAETIATASSEIASGNMDLSARTESRPVRWKRRPRRWKS